MAEPKERSDVFEAFPSRVRGIILHELVPEFTDGVHIQLAQAAVTLVRAVSEKPTFDHVLDFLDALRFEVPGFSVRDVLFDSFLDRRDLISDDPDLT
jgi:hypothetical protein